MVILPARSNTVLLNNLVASAQTRMNTEQKRIVARVEELLRWCDRLAVQLHQTRTLGAHLLDATVRQLLAA